MANKLDLLEFLPEKIFTGSGKEFPLNIAYDNEYINMSYLALKSSGKLQHFQEYSITTPRFISKNVETFEVLGLLQAEMGKTQNGCLNFCNSEPKIVKKILRWFEKEFEISRKEWRWYVKINLREPNDEELYLQLMDGVGEYWVTETYINFDKMYPKGLTFVKNTNNEIADNEGTLVIEHKRNLLSQVIKNFVKKITYGKILQYDKELIRAFMRGIIAGEGCIEISKKDKKYRVHITATKEEERLIYKKCLENLEIVAKVYDNYKDIIVSQRQNLIQLLRQRLVTISPSKYSKFFYMMQQYQEIIDETGYFLGNRRNVWNKYPKEKIDKILELYNVGVTRTKDIARKVEVSATKVNSVLKEYNLGKRAIKYPEEKKIKILEFIKQNPNIVNREIALRFDISKSSIQRLRTRYNCRRARSCFKTTQDKIDRIVQIYKENPTIKIEDICKDVGVSHSVVQKVRRDFELNHLRFMHMIGNNNRKYKEKSI